MPDHSSSLAARGCTAKALIVGLIGAVCIGIGSPYNDMIIKGTGLAIWSLTPAAIFLFFLLVAVVNVLLRLIHPRLALQRGELAVSFVLILLANTLAGRGLPAQLLPVITGAYYYAIPENNWVNSVHPHMPVWPIPQGHEVIWGFYEGSASGQIPWAAWLAPLLYWTIFALAFFLAMVCLMVIVRRQWVEHERLSFPMVQLPLAMIVNDKDSIVPPLFRSGLMWLGFAIPSVLGSINALHNYFGSFPSIRLSAGSIPIFRGMASINLGIDLTMVGFSYFIPQNVALGLSFFYLMNQIQRGLLGMLAWGGKDETMGAYSLYTDSSIIHQAMGGMLALVLGTLWIGRHHLRDVMRKAFLGDESVRDDDEIASYRTAVFGAIAAFLVLGVWLWQSGIPLVFVPLLLAGAFAGFITMARIAAQGGVAYMFPPTNGSDFVASSIGGSLLGAKGMAGLAVAYVWSVDTLILLMTACANGLKLISEVDIAGRRRLFVGIVAVIVLTLGCVVGLTLYLAYQHGAINLSNFYFNNVAQYPYRFMEKSITTPGPINPLTWSHIGLGAMLMGGFMLANFRFLWWPFHPVGFPVSCVFGSMWCSVFVAWMIKGTILKYGGMAQFNRFKPFFLGLILGDAVVAGIWVVVDYFTGMIGNVI